MDGRSRPPRRAIRTIGRMISAPEEDIVVEQTSSHLRWHAGMSRDFAIAHSWKPDSSRQARPSSRIESVAALETAARRYDQHQTRVLLRALASVDQAAMGESRPGATYAPPEVALETLLHAISSLARSGDLPASKAASIRSRCVSLGEYVARVSALVDLYRIGHITVSELQHKRADIAREIEANGLLASARIRNYGTRDTIAR